MKQSDQNLRMDGQLSKTTDQPAPEPIEIDDDGKRFREHLEKASRIVSAWPAWKQTVLGGRAISARVNG